MPNPLVGWAIFLSSSQKHGSPQDGQWAAAGPPRHPGAALWWHHRHCAWERTTSQFPPAAFGLSCRLSEAVLPGHRIHRWPSSVAHSLPPMRRCWRPHVATAPPVARLRALNEPHHLFSSFEAVPWWPGPSEPAPCSSPELRPQKQRGEPPSRTYAPQASLLPASVHPTCAATTRPGPAASPPSLATARPPRGRLGSSHRRSGPLEGWPFHIGGTPA
mmetsp:Transcript_69474/g.109593  ORF Transcript_69474/g.109593 Transcript_69474/m.109593 type:complete len:217 (-) Transcript_69474:215-865(-)